MIDSYKNVFTDKYNITNGAMGALLVILTVFLKHLYKTTVTFLMFGQEIFAIPTSYYSLRQVIIDHEKSIVNIGAACDLCDEVHWLVLYLNLEICILIVSYCLQNVLQA